jgi:hypothetical protein
VKDIDLKRNVKWLASMLKDVSMQLAIEGSGKDFGKSSN